MLANMIAKKRKSQHLWSNRTHTDHSWYDQFKLNQRLYQYYVVPQRSAGNTNGKLEYALKKSRHAH